MARIRTIKPEFWTDERLTECSLSARLMFIGMLNFSDDNGNQSNSAKRIKMQVFPADSIDTVPLLNELIAHGLLIEYSVNGENFLNIKGFNKHQKINRPSETAIPKFINSEDSVSTHKSLTESSLTEGKGREGKGEELKAIAISPKANPERPDCPHQEIIAAYHEILPTCRQVRDWTTARQSQLRARWNEDKKRQSIDYWRRFFEYVGGCDFLVGKGDYGKDRKPFFVDLEWLTNSKNFTKIIERKYE